MASKSPGLVALGILVFVAATLISSVTTVPTRAVGVVTTFNKPTGETYTAGAHLKAPWKNVTDMSLAWQTVNYQFEVQAAGGATVGLDIRPRWRMKEAAAPELFQDYKNFEGVVDNLFKTELVAAGNKLFAAYNPLTAYDVKTSLPVKAKSQWEQEFLAEMNLRLGTKLEFERVGVITIAPDPKSQEKLNQQIEEFGRGKVLDQAKINADKEAAITATNAGVDKATRCMEIAEKTSSDPGTCALFENKGAGVIIGTGKAAK
jgi:regulator of protease activity HflC (stomatin/prohibitin superfamily)